MMDADSRFEKRMDRITYFLFITIITEMVFNLWLAAIISSFILVCTFLIMLRKDLSGISCELKEVNFRLKLQDELYKPSIPQIYTPYIDKKEVPNDGINGRKADA